MEHRNLNFTSTNCHFSPLFTANTYLKLEPFIFLLEKRIKQRVRAKITAHEIEQWLQRTNVDSFT